MSSLYVYTTEGSCIYPEGGSDDASVNRYFESVNFVADVRDPRNPSVEAYFRAVLPSGRPEQLFLRFQGDDPASLFEDCRNAVRNELVQTEGWTIQATEDTSDPSMVFQRAVLRPPEDPSRVFDNTPLAGRVTLLQSAVHGNRKPLSVNGRNYRIIADAINALRDKSMVMAVADGDISLSGVGLIFNQTSQQYDLALPRDSERLLQQASTQTADQREQTATPEEEQIESELSTIESQLQSIREKDVSQATVRTQLDSVVSDVFPPLSVSAGSMRPGLSSSRSDDESDGDTDDQPVQAPPSEGRFSGILPNVPDGVAIGAAAGLAVVVLLVLVFASGGLGGDGGGGESEFNVTFVDPPKNVTAGESFDVSVRVLNNGTASGEQNITVGAEGLDSSPSKSIRVDGNESRTPEFTLSTSESDGGKYTLFVESENGDRDEGSLTLREPAEFGVTIQDAPDEIVAGEEIEVTTSVSNTGDEEATQDIVLSVDGLESTPEESVTLGGGESTTVTLTVETGTDDSGDSEVTVESDDDSVSRNLQILQSASFDVSIIGASLSETEIDVTFEVENTGEVDGETQVMFETEPDIGSNSTETLEIAAGNSRTIQSFSIPVDDSDSETVDVIANVDGDEKDRQTTD